MRVTIKDVAKLAGVAPSTVTRVIQNKSTISDETKKRVREAMVELDYHPARPWPHGHVFLFHH